MALIPSRGCNHGWLIGAAGGGVIQHDKTSFANVFVATANQFLRASAHVLAETALTWQTIASASNAANRGHRRNKDTLDLGRKDTQKYILLIGTCVHYSANILARRCISTILVQL